MSKNEKRRADKVAAWPVTSVVRESRNERSANLHCIKKIPVRKFERGFFGKGKIILVEDDFIEAMDIKRTLESFGYEVPYVAHRGNDTIIKAIEIRPDLILVDIILKGDKNGIDVASELKDSLIPIIYLTAHSEDSTVQKAKLTGPYGYIIKPYDSSELKYAIELALYKSKMEKN